jgi:tetratricopeptide (TPR) repeat protein
MKRLFVLFLSLTWLLTASANESSQVLLEPDSRQQGLDQSGTVGSAAVSIGTPEDRFHQASAAYEAKDPEQALIAWRDLVDDGFDGFELWYNMGNAAWRLGESAEALLYWERAALHAPFDPDLNANLELARESLIDRVSDAPRLQIWNQIDQLFLLVPQKLPAGFGLIFLWLASTLIVLGRLGRAPLSRRMQRLVLWLLVVMSLSSFSFMALRNWALTQQDPGILMAESVVVRSAPSAGSIALFDLHGGVRVWIQSHSLDSEGKEWIELKLADGRLGWSLAEFFVPIKSRRLP